MKKIINKGTTALALSAVATMVFFEIAPFNLGSVRHDISSYKIISIKSFDDNKKRYHLDAGPKDQFIKVYLTSSMASTSGTGAIMVAVAAVQEIHQHTELGKILVGIPEIDNAYRKIV